MLVIEQSFCEISLTPEEQARYARHWALPEVGPAGQQKLKSARVLVVGAGGLGCPMLAYLAAAGVGTLGIVDFDKVDVSNLQRQILHTTPRIGWPKVESAAAALAEINPNVKVQQHPEALEVANALDILREYDVVADGTDNLPARYLINDACALLGKPYVYGSVLRFEGRASVFWKGHGPCYRCLHPEPPLPETAPSCAEAGVLGVLPGIVGTLQAAEILKLILGKGESLLGRLLVLDGLRMKFKEIQLRPDPDCPCCSPKASFHNLADLQGACSPAASPSASPFLNTPEPMAAGQEPPEISVCEFKAKLDAKEDSSVLDVREAAEWEKGRLPGALWIPLGQLKARLHELDRERTLYVHCKTGMRSQKAWKLLKDSGFARVKVVQGGIVAWREQIDPNIAVL